VGRIALTFDDGPDPRWTPAVLDALRDARAPATFFVLGPLVRRHPAIVRRALAEGHAVAPHSEHHVAHTDHDAAAGAADLDAVLAALAAAGAPHPGVWRTPYGSEAEWTHDVAAARGLRVVGWSADTYDWRGHDVATMLALVEPDLIDGAIVLAHDAVGPGALRDGCAETVALVAPLVALARERGLEPAPLS
jgi:peptidoglycan/xylan/chitin deacetylase (PgdA/CDA1 family)